MIGFFYDLLFLLPLALASSLIAKPYFADDASAALYTLVTVLVSLFILFMNHFKLRERLIATGIAVTTVAALVFAREEGTRLNYISDNIWVLKVSALIFGIALILMITRGRKTVRFIPAVIALLILPLSLFCGFSLDKASVLFLFMFALITFADTRSKHLVFISPFILAVFIIAAIVPVSSKPYGWGFVKKIYEGIQSSISSVNRFLTDTGWDSASPFIGFSDDGRFGGNIGGGGYTVLDLTSSTGNDEYLYLAGRVYDTFDGRQWSGDDNTPYPYFDSIETASAALDCTGSLTPEYNDALLDYIRPVTLMINSNSTGSDRTFAPSKIIPVPGSASGSAYDKVSYLRTNTAVPAFSDMITGGHTVTADSWNTALQLLALSGDNSYDLSHYDDYKKQIKIQYLPGTRVSDAVRDLTDDIVGDADSDYEKLTRIEEMLRGGRYTEKPGNLPEDLSSAADYLDYFLFEKREGYCSYYATAFVLLARSCGVPARLVQGYRVPAGDRLHIKVSSADAHAWAQAYMDGVGWITFEPTPGMKPSEKSSGWMTAEEAAEYYRSHYGPDEADADIAAAEDTNEAEPEETSFAISRVLIPVLCGALFTAILIAIDALLKRRRYMLSSDREKALWLCQRSMHTLEKRGRGRDVSETLSEYRERLRSIPAPEDLTFLDIYENLLYSTGTIGQEEVRKLEGSYLH